MMFGLGGTLVEILKDVSFRLAPMWKISAERMVRQIRSFKVLDGFRGSPPRMCRPSLTPAASVRDGL